MEEEEDTALEGLVKGEKVEGNYSQKEKKRETTRVRTQGPLMETAKVVTFVHLIQTAS